MYCSRSGVHASKALARSLTEKVAEGDVLLIWKATKEANTHTMGMRYFPNIVLWPFVGAYGMHRASVETDTNKRRMIYAASSLCFLGPAFLALVWTKAKSVFVNKLTLDKSSNILTFEMASFFPWITRTKLYTVKDVVPVQMMPNIRSLPSVMRVYPSIVMRNQEGNTLFLFKGQGFRDRNTFSKLLQGTIN